MRMDKSPPTAIPAAAAEIASEAAVPLGRSSEEHRDDYGDCSQDHAEPSRLPALCRCRPEAGSPGRSISPSAGRRTRREGAASGRWEKVSLIMTSARNSALLAAATVLSGWLAGAALERSAVGTPVWRALGPEAWASFSRSAAFGTGLTMDAAVGIVAAALMFAAAVSGHFDRDGRRETPVSLILALIFSLIGLLLTAKAAHLVQFLDAAQPAADLQPIFDEYVMWGVDLRAAADATAFVAAVWTLLAWGPSAAPRSSSAAEPAAVGHEGVEGGGYAGATRTD
jgi:hypothetical protein